jgi:hypothetical protein
MASIERAISRIRQSGLFIVATVLLSSCADPYPKADAPVAVVPVPQLHEGDSWVYVQINGYNRLPERTLTDTLRRTSEGFVVERKSDRANEPILTETISAPWRETGETGIGMKRSFSSPLARIALPIAPGQSWQESSTVTDGYGNRFLWQAWGHAVGWERVRTPAGEFVALRVERQMNLGDYDYAWSDTHVVETYWYAPEVKRWVRLEHRYDRVELWVKPHIRRNQSDWIVWELKEFRPA